jgi:hypothetical protein
MVFFKDEMILFSYPGMNLLTGIQIFFDSIEKIF